MPYCHATLLVFTFFSGNCTREDYLNYPISKTCILNFTRMTKAKLFTFAGPKLIVFETIWLG